MAHSTHDRCARLHCARRVEEIAAPPADAREDTDLRRRFRDGDPDAVREVYIRYSRPLYALSRSWVADREQAHDVVQQTFLQAWRAASSFDADRPLAPWLFQICRRVCIDRHRRQRAATETLDDHERHPALAVAGPSLERSWVTWEVRRAIDALPPDGREVVRLLHLEGFTVEQAAARLRLPVGTVKSRSFRAHKRLVAALAHLRPADEALAA